MSAMSNYLEKKLLDHTLGIAAFTMPTTVYLAAFTADPGETGSLSSEVAGASYARQEVTSKMTPTNNTTGVSANDETITFGPAGEDWGTITHIAFVDAPTGGNVLLLGPMSSNRTIQENDSLQFAASQLSATFG